MLQHKQHNSLSEFYIRNNIFFTHTCTFITLFNIYNLYIYIYIFIIVISIKSY